MCSTGLSVNAHDESVNIDTDGGEYQSTTADEVVVEAETVSETVEKTEDEAMYGFSVTGVSATNNTNDKDITVNTETVTVSAELNESTDDGVNRSLNTTGVNASSSTASSSEQKEEEEEGASLTVNVKGDVTVNSENNADSTSTYCRVVYLDDFLVFLPDVFKSII